MSRMGVVARASHPHLHEVSPAAGCALQGYIHGPRDNVTTTGIWTPGPTYTRSSSRSGMRFSLLRRGARNVRVFGSVARGEAGPESDLDIPIDLEPGRGLLDAGSLSMDLSLLFGRPVDVVTEAGLRERIRFRALREARSL